MRILVSAVFFLTLPTASSLAGTICGTVRDALTLQPVSHAAIFLFDALDQYTGLYAGTDPGGRYCIAGVPNGTYTVEVRVDDYVASVVRGVVVDDATDVDITVSPRFSLAEPAPNPATDGVTFRFRIPEDANVTLEVFDVRGRVVKGWRGAGGGVTHWDLRDTHGNLVASGVYLVRLHANGQQLVRHLVCVR